MERTTIQQLGDVEVLDTAGTKIRLGTLWQSQPVLLAMIRHFG